MPEMTLKQAMELATRHHHAGQIREAEALYRQIITYQPADGPALHMLGVVRAQAGGYDEAAILIARAIQVEPSNAGYRANLANVLQESGRVGHAIPLYREALELAPNSPGIMNNLGNALQIAGDLAAAVETYRAAIHLRPTIAEAHFNLANALNSLGRYDEAITSYREALRLRPEYPEAMLNLGLAMLRLEDLAGAFEATRRALDMRPDWPEAYKNLGKALEQMGRYEEAVGCFREVARLLPQSAESMHDLGNALQESGRLDESVGAYRRSISMKLDYVDSHYGLAWALLRKGDLQAGLREYEWRDRLSEAAPNVRLFKQPRWDGLPLNGKTILLHAEQGFGDTLFALRYVSQVAARGGRICLQVPQPLKRLLESFPGVEQLISDGEPPGEFDVHCPLMSLPLIFETKLEAVSHKVPYIQARQPMIEQWAGRLGDSDWPRMKIGMVWAGRPTPRNRSIPFGLIVPLLQMPGVQFHSLQKSPQAEQSWGYPIVDWDAQLTDFAETAGLIANLDLVITIDTAVAHLAGAMNKPAWLMLQYAADWRWFHDRSDSPWYPSVRIFRQPTPHDWRGVINQVYRQLCSEPGRQEFRPPAPFAPP